MASAIELEIQERRVKKARLDVEEEEINVRRMELALQRSKVEEQTEALQRSKIEEQAEALVSSPTETSSTASNLDALLWAIQSASPLRPAPQILMPAPEYPVGQRACVYWPAMRQSYAGKITETRADGAVFVSTTMETQNGKTRGSRSAQAGANARRAARSSLATSAVAGGRRLRRSGRWKSPCSR